MGVGRASGGSPNDCDARVLEEGAVTKGICRRFERRDDLQRRPRLQDIDLRIPNQDSADFVFR